MDMTVKREDVWAASIEDKPGALAQKLSALAEAGADLDFVIARRSASEPWTGVAFVTPLRSDREIRAATEAGFAVARHLHSVRIEGANQPGIAATVAQKVGDTGINMRGFSGTVIGTKFVLHIGVDSAEDAEKVKQVLS